MISNASPSMCVAFARRGEFDGADMGWVERGSRWGEVVESGKYKSQIKAGTSLDRSGDQRCSVSCQLYTSAGRWWQCVDIAR